MEIPKTPATPVSVPPRTSTAARLTPSPKPGEAPRTPTDNVRVQGAGDQAKVRGFEVQANFDTGAAALGSAALPALNQTLDAVVASFKTLTPEQQKALLADPNFRIEIEGHASNLGSAKKYDNLGLSRKRAEATAAYVKDYLKQRGIDVPDAAIQTRGAGNPGGGKATDDNDPADRAAKVKFVLPGLEPLPSAPAHPNLPHHRPADVTPPAKPQVPAKPETPAVPAATPTAEPVPPVDPAVSETTQALNDFNKTILPVGDLLTKGRAQDTKLAEREALVTKAQDALKGAEVLLPKLEPTAQLGAQALINSYRDQVGTLAQRAGQERADFGKVTAQLKGDGDKLVAAASGSDKGALLKLVTQLNQTYQHPDELGKGLPEDARSAITAQSAELKKQIKVAIARHSDDSDIDRPDNSYLFGRPGPKFKTAWESLEALLKSSGPLSTGQRQKATEDLNAMSEAVRKFDDPLTKDATQSVFDDVSRAVYTRLAGT